MRNKGILKSQIIVDIYRRLTRHVVNSTYNSLLVIRGGIFNLYSQCKIKYYNEYIQNRVSGDKVCHYLNAKYMNLSVVSGDT